MCNLLPGLCFVSSLLMSSSSAAVNLPKPSISSNVHREVIWGEDVEITCSISTQHLGGKFTLGKSSNSFTPQSRRTSSSSATFHIRHVNFDNEGPYWCQYQTSVSSQNVLSPKSDHIHFSVVVPQLQPEITLSSPDGALQWSPGGAVEITWGHSFVITCSVPTHYPGGLFTLIFSGSTTNDHKLAVNRSASFEFPSANYDHHGDYSCVYEVTLSSRKFTSAETSISVVIRLPLLMLVSSISAGSLLLLLLVVLLVIFLVCKRRKHVRRRGVSSLTQMAVRNRYEDSDDEEESNYVNVDPVQCKSMQKAQPRGMLDEEADQENEWSDGDHDYEDEPNSDGRGFVQSLDTYMDTSDGDDYVNVMQPFAENAPYIYGEQMDIYQNF